LDSASCSRRCRATSLSWASRRDDRLHESVCECDAESSRSGAHCSVRRAATLSATPRGVSAEAYIVFLELTLRYFAPRRLRGPTLILVTPTRAHAGTRRCPVVERQCYLCVHVSRMRAPLRVFSGCLFALCLSKRTRAQSSLRPDAQYSISLPVATPRYRHGSTATLAATQASWLPEASPYAYRAVKAVSRST